MKLAILLTATVKVQVRGGQFSIGERAEMYASTLRYYAKKLGGGKNCYPIIFCENSDYDLSEFKKEFDSQMDIEWIQLRPDSDVPFDPKKGKGFNEYLMIKESLIRSKKLKACTHFLKITGRYSMLNILSMIREIERRADNKVFMGDIKDTKIYDLIGRKNTDSGHWGDSRYWVADVDYYKSEMADCYMEMDDRVYGRYSEDYLLRLGRDKKNDGRFIFRFRTQVLFNGITSSKSSDDLKAGRYMQDSIGQRMKWCVRQVMRWLFPNFWF